MLAVDQGKIMSSAASRTPRGTIQTDFDLELEFTRISMARYKYVPAGFTFLIGAGSIAIVQ